MVTITVTDEELGMLKAGLAAWRQELGTTDPAARRLAVASLAITARLTEAQQRSSQPSSTIA